MLYGVIKALVSGIIVALAFRNRAAQRGIGGAGGVVAAGFGAQHGLALARQP